MNEIKYLQNLFNQCRSDFVPSIYKSGDAKGYKVQLIWQYLRHNEHFKADYRTTSKDWPNEDSEESFCKRWMMNQTVCPDTLLAPNDLSFRFQAVYSSWSPKIGNKKFLAIMNLMFSNRTEPLILVVNPLATESVALQQAEASLKASLESNRARLPTRKAAKANSFTAKQLFSNFLLYYFSVTKKLAPSEIDKKFREISKLKFTEKKRLQSAEIKRRSKQFLTLAQESPWIFFSPPTK